MKVLLQEQQPIVLSELTLIIAFHYPTCMHCLSYRQSVTGKQVGSQSLDPRHSWLPPLPLLLILVIDCQQWLCA